MKALSICLAGTLLLSLSACSHPDEGERLPASEKAQPASTVHDTTPNAMLAPSSTDPGPNEPMQPVSNTAVAASTDSQAEAMAKAHERVKALQEKFNKEMGKAKESSNGH